MKRAREEHIIAEVEHAFKRHCAVRQEPEEPSHNKRKRADLARSAPTGLESVAAQTRKQEAELSRDVMEDALNVDNQFEV